MDALTGEGAEEDGVEEVEGEAARLKGGGEEEAGSASSRRAGPSRGRCKELWKKMKAKLWGIVESKYFNRGIMMAILINTISMGIEHHEQVESSVPFFCDH